MQISSFKLLGFLILSKVTCAFYLVETSMYHTVQCTRTGTLSKLDAWTLPKSTNKNPFDKFSSSSFSASWYDDHNPTSRKVVYNDSDQDEVYRFFTSFSADNNDMSANKEPRTTDNVINPSRRALRHIAGKVYKRLRQI
jgi:hypothetical protein